MARERSAHKFAGEQQKLGPLSVVTGKCQIPCERPVMDHFWKCQCFDPTTNSDPGDRWDDRQIRAFVPPASSLPEMPNCPVKMGEYTMTSNPVLAFPVSIDYLVAAAFATKRAIYLKKLLRPILERAEVSSARKAAGSFNHKSPMLDGFLQDEISRQCELIWKQPADWSDDDSDDESDDDKPKEDPWTTGSRLGPYDIRTFREIHAMMHAAYIDAHDGWVLARNDSDLVTEHELYYHLTTCDQNQWQRYDQRAPFDSTSRSGCRSLDPDYWDILKEDFWINHKIPIQNVLDYEDAIDEDLVEDEIENGFEFPEEHLDWYRALREDMEAQRIEEMRHWRDELIGENGQHSWIQRNVVEVLEENFKGMKITIINATVLDVDSKHSLFDGARNFMPMAWIHLPTEWTKTANAPYVKPGGFEDEDEDEDMEDDLDGNSDSDAEEDGPDNIKCHQGYAPVIPGDPGHWYSNAARDASNGGQTQRNGVELALLKKFVDLFGLHSWLHPLQFLPPGYENLTESLGIGRTLRLKGGLMYHLSDRIAKTSCDSKWPAIVQLRKVVHEAGEGETRSPTVHSSASWDRHNHSDPTSEGDLDHQENKSHVAEIREYLDSILDEVNPRPEKKKSYKYTWSDDEQEHDEHEQDRELLESIASVLENTDGSSDQLARFQKFRSKYEKRRKNARRGVKRVESMQSVVNEAIRKARVASEDLDKLRRKNRENVKNLRITREALQTENDGLKSEKTVTTHHYKKTKSANVEPEASQKKAELDADQLNTENERLRNINSKLQKEKKQTDRELDRLQKVIKKLQTEKVQAKLKKKKLSLTKRRQKVGKRKDRSSSSSDDDEHDDDEQPPKKKPKTTGSGSADPIKSGKDKGKPPSTSTKNSVSGPASPKKQNSGKNSPAERPASKAVIKPAESQSNPEGQAKVPAKVPAKAPTKPTPKSTAKPAAKPAAEPAAKTAATKKPAATAAPASTPTGSQPTRTSRRLNNQAAEVEKVSDPEKEAKKEKGKGKRKK